MASEQEQALAELARRELLRRQQNNALVQEEPINNKMPRNIEELKQLFGTDQRQAVGNEYLGNLFSNMPHGFKEALNSAKAGVLNEEFVPSLPSNAPGAELGFGIGQGIGDLAAPVIGGAAGTVIGGPIGGVIGSGLGAAAATPGDTFDRTTAGLLGAALPGAGLALSKLFKIGAPVLRGYTASNLKKAKSLIGDTKIPVDKALINEAKEFLPKSKSAQKLLDAAEKGEYDAAFGTQSQIGEEARALKKGPAADRRMSPIAHELKQNMLMDMDSKLRAQGLDKEADLLRLGVQDVRKYHEVKDKVVKALKKIGYPIAAWALFDKFILKMDKSILNHE